MPASLRHQVVACCTDGAEAIAPTSLPSCFLHHLVVTVQDIRDPATRQLRHAGRCGLRVVDRSLRRGARVPLRLHRVLRGMARHGAAWSPLRGLAGRGAEDATSWVRWERRDSPPDCRRLSWRQPAQAHEGALGPQPAPQLAPFAQPALLAPHPERASPAGQQQELRPVGQLPAALLPARVGCEKPEAQRAAAPRPQPPFDPSCRHCSGPSTFLFSPPGPHRSLSRTSGQQTRPQAQGHRRTGDACRERWHAEATPLTFQHRTRTLRRRPNPWQRACAQTAAQPAPARPPRSCPRAPRRSGSQRQATGAFCSASRRCA